MSRQNAFKKVKEFHVDQIVLYTQNVVGNKMNKIKPKYLNREKNLIEALESFENQSQEHQILNLEYYSIEFGCYTTEFDAVYFGNIESASF